MGLRNLPELIVAAGGRVPVGIMIARGDLAAEIGFERLSEIQEELLWLCEAAEVPVVWATQVLEGMVKEGQPSRGEMTDAAMSQRAECVMLNKGPHIVAAVRMLREVLTRMDRHQTKKSPRLGALGLWHEA
jgi:pyruvate kinase